jgi:hypothetical protein
MSSPPTIDEPQPTPRRAGYLAADADLGKGDNEPNPKARSKKPYAITAALVAAVAGGTAGVLALSGDGPGAATPASSISQSTAEITRGDVVDTESVDGELVYPDERTIPATAHGTVTWTPAKGRTIRRGQSLYKVNDKPVTLIYGSLPLYRSLGAGDEGPDVEQLERNLKALGYGNDLTVDDDYTAATATAVKNWQEDRGLTETGRVDNSQLDVESGPVRVNDVKLTKGAPTGGGPALTVTGTTQDVDVALDVSKQDLVRKGAQVKVEMPAGNTVTGRITSVGSVATATKDGDATIDVDIHLTTRATGHLDQAPVTVELVSERARKVLSVPVEALLGLSEGGFGVEIIDGTSTRTVAVETGTYGGGRVEISGDDLREGMKVGVPSS